MQKIKFRYLASIIKPNSRILGIDYGLKKIGSAIFHNCIDNIIPLKVIRNFSSVYTIIEQLIKENTCIAVVIGISSGGRNTKDVIELQKTIQTNVFVPVFLQNEDLTTFSANEILKELGVNYRRRNSVDDAIAAQLILESFMCDFKKYIRDK